MAVCLSFLTSGSVSCSSIGAAQLNTKFVSVPGFRLLKKVSTSKTPVSVVCLTHPSHVWPLWSENMSPHKQEYSGKFIFQSFSLSLLYWSITSTGVTLTLSPAKSFPSRKSTPSIGKDGATHTITTDTNPDLTSKPPYARAQGHSHHLFPGSRPLHRPHAPSADTGETLDNIKDWRSSSIPQYSHRVLLTPIHDIWHLSLGHKPFVHVRYWTRVTTTLHMTDTIQPVTSRYPRVTTMARYMTGTIWPVTSVYKTHTGVHYTTWAIATVPSTTTSVQNIWTTPGISQPRWLSLSHNSVTIHVSRVKHTISSTRATGFLLLECS